MWPFGNQKITLEYNNVKYTLRPKDIPGLKGSGRISIVNRKGMQRQSTSGNFYGKLEQRQDGEKCFINGVEISALVRKLKSRI